MAFKLLLTLSFTLKMRMPCLANHSTTNGVSSSRRPRRSNMNTSSTSKRWFMASSRSSWMASRSSAEILKPETPFSHSSLMIFHPCCSANLRHSIRCMGISSWSTCPLVDTRYRHSTLVILFHLHWETPNKSRPAGLAHVAASIARHPLRRAPDLFVVSLVLPPNIS